jgi:serine O-acetyltransferase
MSGLPTEGDGARDRDRPGLPGGDRFSSVVDALCAANRGLRARRGARRVLPSRDAIAAAVGDLRAVLFPGHFGASDLDGSSLRFTVGAQLDRARRTLGEQVRRGLTFTCAHQPAGEPGAGDEGERCPACDRRAAEVSDAMLDSLPAIRGVLEDDL